MNRTEFLVELERLLGDISPSEREEALQYYRDFLDDAGSENDEEAIRSLGSPADIAATIKRDLPVQTPAMVKDEKQGENQKQNSNSNNNTLLIVLLIVLCPFWIPLAIGAAAVIFSVVVSFLAIVFSLFISFAAITIALIFSAFVFIGVGIAKMIVAPLGGICLIGAGFLCAGIGMLFLVLTIWMVGMLIPALFHGIGKLFSNAFKKKEGSAA